LTQKTKRTETGKETTRQRIATALIYERLGLDGDWRDPDFEISLPETLPRNRDRILSSPEARELESGLARLVALGCNKRALYWCIGQLGSEAEEARQGKRLIVKVNEDERKNQEIKVNPAMATRQDMAGLINKVRAASVAIKKHRSELLMVADACRESIDLPSGFLTDLELPEEAMMILLQSLSWVQKLASAWESPNPTALMKSKGLLFLLVYVWLHTTNQPDGGGAKKHSGTKRATPYRIPNDAVQNLAEIVHLYQGVGFTAVDLNDKLQDFAVNEPTVFNTLVALAKVVDQTARRRSTGT
jgi:hypothetical protein